MITFRVENQNSAGSGHFYRCLKLAKSIKSRGINANFLLSTFISYQIELLEKLAFEYELIPKQSKSGSQEDLVATVKFLNINTSKAIVLDGYSFSSEYLVKLRNPKIKVIEFTDTFKKKYSSDLVIYHHPYERDEIIDSMILNNKNTKFLFGREFTLVDKNPYICDSLVKVKNVIVFFGAKDSKNMSEKIISCLVDGFGDICFNIIIGASNSKKNNLKQLIKSKKNFNIIDFKSNHDFLEGYDLFLGSAGNTTYEVISINLPSIVISTNPMQLGMINYLTKRKLINYFGSHDTYHEYKFKDYFKKIVADVPLLRNQQKEMQKFFDGKGPQRLADNLIEFIEI